jgi:prevent-host-death family protein
MRTYKLHEARSAFSKLVERALAGEPQCVTRYGKDAVIIVSEAEWSARRRSAPTLGTLLARHAREHGFETADFERPFEQRRPLGTGFVD